MKHEVNDAQFEYQDLVDLKTEIKTLLKENLACSFCKRTFATRKGFKLHQSKILDGICSNDRERKKAPEPLFNCAICPAKFKAKHWLARHEQRGHESPICVECDRTFHNKQVFNLHNEKFHLKIRFTCPTCGKIFTTQSHLSTHKKNIHENKKWDCLQCEKQFASSGALSRHVRVVHDKIKEICPICKKELAYLDSHIEDKHEGKVYKCKFCNDILSSRTSHIAHMRRHQGKLFECKDCDKSFRDKSTILRHAKKFHSDDAQGSIKCSKCSNSHLAKFNCSALSLLLGEMEEESKASSEIPFQSLIG